MVPLSGTEQEVAMVKGEAERLSSKSAVRLGGHLEVEAVKDLEKFVAKHRSTKNNSTTRRVVAASAAVAGVGALAPVNAGAAEVVIPNTDFRFDVEGIEHIPGIDQIPGIDDFIPSLGGQNQVPAPAPAPAPAPVPAPASAPAPASSSSIGQAIVDVALSKVGSPYSWGAAGPYAFDCSGFTSWVYAQVGIHIPRTSQGQASAGRQVSLDNLQPGDIIVYYSGATHVAIYIGNGQMVDALNSSSPVSVRPVHYMPYHSAVRFY